MENKGLVYHIVHMVIRIDASRGYSLLVVLKK
jgi:hypothetical protein